MRQLIGVSGSVRIPGTVDPPARQRVFRTEEVSWDRGLDSEVKILEEIATRLQPSSRGVVRLFSERPICASCSSVISQFQERFPGVVVLPSAGRPVRSHDH